METAGLGVGRLWVVLPAWLLTQSIAGALVEGIHGTDLDVAVFLGWLAQMALSAMTIVGLVPLVLQWWFLRTMLEGGSIPWNLWRGFVTQVITASLVVAWCGGGYREDRLGVLAVVGIVVAVLASVLRTWLRKGKGGE